MMATLTKKNSTHYALDRNIEVPFTREENVIIPRPAELRAKIAKMIKDGPKSLFVYTDFDFTLTKKCVYGDLKGDSSFKIVQDVY